MTSIALGTVEVQVAMAGSGGEYQAAVATSITQVVEGVVGRIIEAQLEVEVTQILGRETYVRREGVPREVTRGQCRRCGTHIGKQFQRNGHYRRQLLTRWGQVVFRMPQLVCECGGGVRATFETVRRRQRIWDNVAQEIRERYGWGESLRGIKASLDRWLGSSLGLRTINARVHALAELVAPWIGTQQTDCPPVVRLDGVWVPQMIDTGQQRVDALGRQRPVKQGERRPLLVAQGVWPSRGQQAIVGWTLAQAESADDWEGLLDQMWERGVQPARGLRLLVADGGAGLLRARELVYWNVPLQRCVFHKLRNVWRDLVVPEAYDGVAGRRYKRRLIRQAARIWQAHKLATARDRQVTWCLDYEAEQPAAVATLRRDFDLTLTFYHVQATAAAQGDTWPAACLRTTSHLERLFRGLRRRLRQAIVLHSDTGLTALAYQYFTRWSAGQSINPLDAFDWPRALERQLIAAPAIS
jgi:transposase-like protein